MDPYKSKTKKELIEEIERLKKDTGNARPARSESSSHQGPNSADSDYRRILEEIDDGYWETDLRGNHVFCNSAMLRIIGYSAEEVIGKSYKKLMDTATAEKLKALFKELYKSESAMKPTVYEIIRKDRSVSDVEISAALARSPSGEPVGFRGIMRDITDRVRAIDLEESFKTMRKALGQTVQALSLALEVRDPYTAGHHRRVSDLARSIATVMGLSRDRINGIRIAGSIHDIGKISIPSEILSKPGSLTEIEFKLIKTHPQMGYDILKGIDFPWPVAMTVYQHHERINGSGYPAGIAGKRIIPEARIMAVADVVEAMASHRPYRRAIGTERALEEIMNNRGTLYDGDVVDACILLFREKNYRLQE
ncbi:MAG: PAS domain S-box protein [Spirochaetes bacterium]|nr:PAS domain S-box protein [Spirochaetota bacterium]